MKNFTKFRHKFLLVGDAETIPGQNVTAWEICYSVFFSPNVVFASGIHMGEKLNIAHLSSQGMVINLVLSA